MEIIGKPPYKWKVTIFKDIDVMIEKKPNRWRVFWMWVFFGWTWHEV